MKYFNLTNMFACTNCGAVSKVEGKEHQHWHGFCPNCMSPMRVCTSNVEPERPEPKWKTGHPEHEKEVVVRVKDHFGGYYYRVNRWINGENGDWYFQMIGKRVLGWCEIPEFDIEFEG